MLVYHHLNTPLPCQYTCQWRLVWTLPKVMLHLPNWSAQQCTWHIAFAYFKMCYYEFWWPLMAFSKQNLFIHFETSKMSKERMKFILFSLCTVRIINNQATSKPSSHCLLYEKFQLQRNKFNTVLVCWKNKKSMLKEVDSISHQISMYAYWPVDYFQDKLARLPLPLYSTIINENVFSTKLVSSD